MKNNFKLLIVFSTLLSLGACGIKQNNSSNTSSTHSSIEVPQYEYYNATYMNPISITNNGEAYNGGLSDPAFVVGDNGYYYMVCGNTLLKSSDCCNWLVLEKSVSDILSPFLFNKLYFIPLTNVFPVFLSISLTILSTK